MGFFACRIREQSNFVESLKRSMYSCCRRTGEDEDVCANRNSTFAHKTYFFFSFCLFCWRRENAARLDSSYFFKFFCSIVLPSASFSGGLGFLSETILFRRQNQQILWKMLKEKQHFLVLSFAFSSLFNLYGKKNLLCFFVYIFLLFYWFICIWATIGWRANGMWLICFRFYYKLFFFIFFVRSFWFFREFISLVFVFALFDLCRIDACTKQMV